MNVSKIAFMAVCMEPGANTREAQVILVGTHEAWTQTLPDGSQRDWDAGSDWRYACYPMGELAFRLSNPDRYPDLFTANRTSADAIETLLVSTSKNKQGALADLELAALDNKVFNKDFLNDHPATNGPALPAGTTRKQTTLLARNVERVFFFSYNDAHDPQTPFAALDTARYVDPDAAVLNQPMPHPFVSGPVPGGKLGSRLILFPDLSDPTARPGALSALSLHLQIKVAANAHRIPDTASGQFDRRDTRMRLDLALKGGGWPTAGAPKNLWHKLADGNRGMRFDDMNLYCTLASFNGGPPPRSEAKSISGRDLLAFAYDAVQGTDDNDGARAGEPLHIPAFGALGLPDTALAGTKIRRCFGFRSLAVLPDSDIIKKIGWRFELSIGNSGGADALFGHPELQAIFPFPKAGPPRHADLLLAQEQRQAAVALNLTPQAVARTIITLRLGAEKSPGKVDELVTDMVFATFNDALKKVHRGLKAALDGAPMSLLPVFHSKDTRLAWQLVGAMIDASPGVRPLLDGPRRAGAPYVLKATTFEPCARLDMWARDKVPTMTAKAEATLPRLLTQSRRQLRFALALGAPRVSDFDSVPEPNCSDWPAYQPVVTEREPGDVAIGTRMALNASQLLASEPASPDDKARSPLAEQRVIVQALQFKFAEKDGGATGIPLTSGLLYCPLARDAGTDPDDLLMTFDAVMRLPLDEVEAAAEDDIAGMARSSARKTPRMLDRRLPDPDTPLLFPMQDPSSVQHPVHLTLSARESVGSDLSHTCSLSLRATGDKPAPLPDAAPVPQPDLDASPRRRVLIIEPSPFRIAAVDYDPIDGLGTPQNNEVAVWNASGEGGQSWRVRDDKQVVDILCQPQAVGEAMEKNRSDLPGIPQDIAPNQPAAARFGSLTVLKVDPTYADTAFREPGWNLRRILGHATQRAPGARVIEMRLELLYGLLLRIRSENVSITEIAGAIGEPPAALPDVIKDAPHKSRHLARMAAVLKAEQRRLAVEKLWRARPDDDLRLTDGVSYQIRRKTPGIQGGPATPLRWPVPGAIPSDPGNLIDKKILDATFSSSQNDSVSFPGGLSWAFESANVLMRVYGRPESDGGSLRGAYLTALGGFGSQRALFDERKSIVETETGLGRVQRYRLERIGRIACLWHRAKHVIVYERTVVPPGQFYNKPPIGLRQDEHLGRAIPRKVEEYIEILTPLRRYPEDGSAIHEAGFILGAEFKSVKIRVDSTWGSDVRREGWKVPLWNTAFAGLAPSTDPDEPSSLYPMPQVSLLLAGEDGKPVPLELADPEKLHFYTSVIDGEDDNTDLWKAVREVDFCDLPMPQLGRTRTDSADLNDAMLPPAPAVIPGYENFTLTLMPSKDLVAVTHGRVTGGPLTTLRNVTIARADSAAGAEPAPIRDFGIQIALKAANVRAELDRRVGRVLAQLDKLEHGTDPATLATQASALVKQACAGLNASELLDAIKHTQDSIGTIALPQAVGPLCAGITAKLKAQVEGQINRLMVIAADMVKTASLEVNNGINRAAGVAGAETERMRNMVAQAKEGLARLESEAQNAGEMERAASLRAVTTLTNDLLQVIRALQANARADIAKRVGEAKQGIAQVGAHLQNDLAAMRTKTRADLGAVQALINGGLDTAGAELDGFVQQAKAQAAALEAALNASAAVLNDNAVAAGKSCAEQIVDLRKKLAGEWAKVDRGALPAPARRLLQGVDAGLQALLPAARAVAQGIVGQSATAPLLLDAQTATSKMASAGALLTSKFTTAAVTVTTLETSLDNWLGTAFDGAAKLVAQVFDNDLITELTAQLDQAQVALFEALDGLSVPENEAGTLLLALGNAKPAMPFKPALITAAKVFAAAVAEQLEHMLKALARLDGRIDQAHQVLTRETDQLMARLKADALALGEAIKAPVAALIAEVSAQCEQAEARYHALLGQTACVIGKTISGWIGDSLDIANYGTQLEATLNAAINEGKESVNALKDAASKAAAKFAAQAESSARQLAGSIQESLRDATAGAGLEDIARRADGMYQKGDSTLRALAAIGNPPKTSNGIDYNRTDVQFVMNAAKGLGVDMTPTLALVNRAADQVAAVENAGKAVGELLGAFGVRMPVSNIGEYLVPDALKGLSMSDLLPDIAGIDLKGLLRQVGFPDLDDAKAIKLRHSVDQVSMRVTMDADLDIPFAKSVALMSFGPVDIMIDTARFTATARLGAGLDGAKGAMSGKIFGDWRIVSGGQTILTFRKTGLTFDDSGKIDFRIQPDKIELADALKFITDLMGATGQKGGLRIEPFVRGGIPSGVAATLDMVLPPIQSGAFGISDLSLHVMFGLAALPTFEIVSEMSIGMRTAPFTLNVWILNGGGYLMQRLSYLPSAKPTAQMAYTLEIGVVVGLGLGITFGVVSGGVWLQVGCSLAFTWANQGTTTTMRVFLLVRGNVDVCGLITASITLLFEVSYDGASIIGAGTLTVRVKISMFYTLNVDQHIEYVFAGEKKDQGGGEDYPAAYC